MKTIDLEKTKQKRRAGRKCHYSPIFSSGRRVTCESKSIFLATPIHGKRRAVKPCPCEYFKSFFFFFLLGRVSFCRQLRLLSSPLSGNVGCSHQTFEGKKRKEKKVEPKNLSPFLDIF